MKMLNSLSEVTSLIHSNSRVFLQGAMLTPHQFINQLIHDYKRLSNVDLIHIHTEGDAPYVENKYKDSFKVTNLFVGQNVRHAIDYDRVDYLPCFLHEVPALFKERLIDLDVAVVQITPPDINGVCSLGTSVDISLAAVESAKTVIALINPNIPFVYGDGVININQIDFAIEVDNKLLDYPVVKCEGVTQKIAKNISEIIEDGSTLQMGIGAIPDAVLSLLDNHKNLGLHSELVSDGAISLIEKGVINNSLKNINNGISVASFMVGSNHLQNFVNLREDFILKACDYVNDPFIIRQNPRVVAINSAIEVDLTGQVCADSIGPNIFSGVGGQVDFMRGSAMSDGGLPIIAIPSRSKKGISKIVPMLKEGAGVVTGRYHVHYIATEYGIAFLKGKTLGQRANELIKIAHPDEREFLERKWFEIHKKSK